jgi:nucleoside-diphosphate-sugar epimerase
MPPAKKTDLTVAVTGPTGTFGFGLMPLLQKDDRIARIVGIARRPFDPSEHGWTKMEYRQGDVRDRDALEDAFRDADVVCHLAFMITGTAARDTIREINVEGRRTRSRPPPRRAPTASYMPRRSPPTASTTTTPSG